MNILKATLALMAFIGMSTIAHAETFLRPSIGHFFFTSEHFEDGVGGSFAAGVGLGSDGNHAVEFEVGFVEWKGDFNPAQKSSGGFPPVTGGVDTKGEGAFVPLLLGYRYRSGGSNDTWRFYGGVSLGTMHVEGDMNSRQSLPPPYGNKEASISAWRPVAALSLGVEIRCSSNLRLDVGYRFLAVEGETVTLRERADATFIQEQDLGSLSSSIVSIGCNWSF